MKVHYFEQETADIDDIMLAMRYSRRGGRSGSDVLTLFKIVINKCKKCCSR